VARLPQAARSAVVVTICGMLLVVLALSASRWSHNSRQRPPSSPHPHSVDLKWKASVSRVVGYNVYRSETDGGPYIKLTSAPVQATNYTDSSVQSGHIYFYAVTAVDSKGKESIHSSQAKASIPSP
jgi:fibronectin type 3 domain-containing protein